jgi:hypothetical protein
MTWEHWGYVAFAGLYESNDETRGVKRWLPLRRFTEALDPAVFSSKICTYPITRKISHARPGL